MTAMEWVSAGLVSEMPAELAGHLRRCLLESQQIVALYDEADVLRWANAAFDDRFLRGLPFPVSFADILRHGFSHGFGVHVASGDIERFLSDVQTRRRTAPFRAFEVDTVDGQWLWMTETLSAGWLLSIGSDISRLKHNERVLRQEHEQAVRVAQVDALTGISNRRHILELGDRTLAECRQADRAMSIAVVDIDHFKQINDRFGHDMGDDVLCRFARFCRMQLRDADLVGRIGGEEFLVLFPGTSTLTAVTIIGRLRESKVSIPPSTGLPSFTFSAGIAEAEPGETLASMMKRADMALYRAKTNGRNRSELALPLATPVIVMPPSPPSRR